MLNLGLSGASYWLLSGYAHLEAILQKWSYISARKHTILTRLIFQINFDYVVKVMYINISTLEVFLEQLFSTFALHVMHLRELLKL